MQHIQKDEDLEAGEAGESSDGEMCMSLTSTDSYDDEYGTTSDSDDETSEEEEPETLSEQEDRERLEAESRELYQDRHED